MLIENLLQMSDVIKLAINYSLNNNFLNPDNYKSETIQSPEIIEIINKNFSNLKLDHNQDKRIISTNCQASNKEIIIPSRSIFCKHLDCVNYSEMLKHVSIVKLIFV